MIPVKLTLEGLFSYQKKQEIDFRPLVEARLFGIFGPVGSGKSSITEAMLYAIFGSIERLNSHEARSYNMMNLRSNRLWIDFIFNAGNPLQQYRITVESRRKTKNYHETDSFDRKAYQNLNNTWIPIALETINEVIGLSYDNFRRTIIIPQGKFQEFLQLGGTERIKMLKEIFQLEQFDLYNKAKNLFDKTHETLIKVNTRLEGYNNNTPEALNSLQDELNTITIALSQERQKYSELLETERQQALLYSKNQEWQGLKLQFEQLNQEAEPMERNRSFIKNYQSADSAFRSPLALLDELSNRVNSLEKRCKELLHEIEIVQPQKNDIQNLLSQLKQESETIPLRENFVEKIKELLNYRKIQRQNAVINSQIKTLEDKIKENDEILSKKKEAKASIIKEYDAYETQLRDPEEIKQINLWFKDYEKFLDTKQQTEMRKQSALKDIETIKHDVFQNPHLIFCKELLSKKSISEVLEEVQKRYEISKNQLDEIRMQIQSLRVTTKLADFAKELREGMPCPLCGSTSHPHLFSAPEVEAKLTELESKEIQLKAQQQAIINAINELNQYSGKLKIKTEELEKTKQELEYLSRQIDAHLGTFHFEGLEVANQQSYQDFTKKMEFLQNCMRTLNSNRNALEKEIQTLEEKHRQHSDEINHLQQQINFLSGQAKILQQKYGGMEWEENSNCSDTELQIIVDNTNKEIERAKQELKQVEEQAEKIQRRWDEMNAEIKSKSIDLDEAKGKLNLQMRQIEEKLNTSPFVSLEEVREILSKQSQFEQIKLQLEEWENKLNPIKSRLKELEQDADVLNFDLISYEDIKKEVKNRERDVNTLSGKELLIQNQLEEMRLKLEDKNRLMVESGRLKAREMRLNDLKNMFKAHGFVNYVSTIYLKNLVKAANRRFLELTGHQLQLQLNENNEFVVCDMMNDGHLRHIKSLSGGQTFLAAFSMALALADIINGKKPGIGNFFFIDEGFGSLDKNSLRLVFEALSSLQKDNRIVGVISHVEDLQQEIPVSLSVRLDPEKGSQIIPSWLST
ncbi:MAG: SbcC/MukB-like Walker B domain-containing protein [Lentimicrobium sp.]